MTNMTETIVTGCVSGLVSGGLLNLYLQARIQHRYEKAIKRLEAELAQQNFRYSKVFETTEKTIATIYARLLSVLSAVEDYTRLMQGSHDSRRQLDMIKVLNEAFDEFYKYYHPNKIYIPKQIANQINEFLNVVVILLRKHRMANTLAGLQSKSKEGADAQERLDTQIADLEKTISPLLLALEDAFQSILGFPSPNK